jgi:MFS family permease
VQGGPLSRSLWHDRDFLKLWAGETVSDFGDQITLLALPLTAVITLHAGAAEMGLLTAAGTAPTALFSLFAGVWVDRLRRRPILIVADVGRALALATVPLAFVLGLLTMAQLYVVAFITGTLSVLFIISYQSYLPSLVGREHLIEANGRMNASSSVAQLAGPGAAGVLVQLFTAPMPVVLDALSFLASVVGLAAIRKSEPAPRTPPRRDVRAEIREGMVALLGHPVLRALLSCASTFTFFYQAQAAIFVLFLAREIGLSPAQIGLVLAVGSVGAVSGAVMASTVARRIGIGPSFVWGAALAVAGAVIRGLATGDAVVAIATLGLAQVSFSIGFMWWNVNGPALRQALVPTQVLGRVNATWRFAVWGTGPAGALLGGALGEIVGLRSAMIVCGIGCFIPLGLITLSSLAREREIAPLAEATS